MEKIRVLVIDTWAYQVSNVRGIIDPGKFEGEWLHAVRDFNEEDTSFGDSETFGYYWQAGHRYYCTFSNGFVNEISKDDYHAAESEYATWCDENPDSDTLRESLVTEDGSRYYYAGKLAFTVGDGCYINPVESLRVKYDAWCNANNYWPNVYSVSDHGNVHLVEIPDVEN